MKRNDEPTIVSLETHRRQRVAESRKKAAKPARPKGASGERAINWRKVPLALAAMAALMAVSWLIGRVLH